MTRIWLIHLIGIIGSVYKCIREVIPYMREQKSGNIVNIASMYGVVVPDFKVYDVIATQILILLNTEPPKPESFN